MPKDKTLPDPEERFARREGSRDDLRRHVEILIDELLALRQETDPSGGEESAKLKDIHALDALDTAGKLVISLAGWAIAHNLGRALRGLGFIPLAPSRVGHLPEYKDARTAADSHKNELTGRAIITEGGIANDPGTERLVLIDHLRANPGGLPGRLAWRLMEALEALEYGDVHPLLEPRTTDFSKPAYSRMMLQLQALQFVEYRAARGIKKFHAVEEVAEAYGCAESTVRNWREPLCKRIGYLKVTSELAFAHNAGASMRRAQRSIIRHHDKIYGVDALHDAGEKYKRVLGF